MGEPITQIADGSEDEGRSVGGAEGCDWPAIFQVYREAFSTDLAMAVDWWAFNLPLIDFLRQFEVKTILEVGCGDGLVSSLLAMHGYDLTCVDLDQKMLDRAVLRFDGLGLRASFALDDAWNLRPTLSGNAVLTAGLMEHYPEDRGVELLKRLAHHGQMVVTNVPTVQGTYEDPTFARGMCPLEPMTMCRLRRMYRKAGLRVIAGRAYGLPMGWRRWVRALLPPAVWHLLQLKGWCGCALVVVGTAR